MEMSLSGNETTLAPIDQRLAALPRLDWEDPDALVAGLAPTLGGTAGKQLIAAAVERLRTVGLPAGLTPYSVDGAFWVPLAADERVALWVRHTPHGCVAPAHVHTRPFVGSLLSGGYKQTLIGYGGGVGSREGEDVTLMVRNEPRGQVFALHPGQKHTSSSSAGTLLVVLRPRSESPAASRGPEIDALSVVDRTAAAIEAAGIHR